MLLGSLTFTLLRRTVTLRNIHPSASKATITNAVMNEIRYDELSLVHITEDLLSE